MSIPNGFVALAEAPANPKVAGLLSDIIAAAPNIFAAIAAILPILAKFAADMKAGNFVGVIADLQALLAAFKNPSPAQAQVTGS